MFSTNVKVLLVLVLIRESFIFKILKILGT